MKLAYSLTALFLIFCFFSTNINVLGQENNPEEIDIIFVYTPAAKEYEGGETKIKTKLNSLIKELNTSLMNSKNDTRYRLVGIEEINYQEHITDTAYETLKQNLENLTYSRHEQFNKVHELKKTSGADIVFLAADLPKSSCGIAYTLSKNIFENQPPEYFGSHAFAIYNVQCFSLAFSHEVSHIMGNNHANTRLETAITNEAYSYQFTDPQSPAQQQLVTITGGGGKMIPYWSNPEVTYHGVQIGEYGKSCETCVVNLTRNYIANISPKKTSTIVEWNLNSLQYDASKQLATLKGSTQIPYAILSISTDGRKTWKEYPANNNEVNIQLEGIKADTSFDYTVNNGRIQNYKINLPETERNIQKSCSVSLSKNSVSEGESISLTLQANSTNTSNEPVRVFLKKVDNTKIIPQPEGTSLVENTTAKTNYYQFGDSVCQSSNGKPCTQAIQVPSLKEGTYQLHCDLENKPNSCSGNPNCSFNGGPFACEGWQSCGEKDFVTFTVNKKEEKYPNKPDYNNSGIVDIYDYSLLAENYKKTNCDINLMGSCTIDSADLKNLVAKFGK